MEIIHREDDEITMLYEASMKGDVTLLDTLIRKDKLILQKLSPTLFTETPLHVAALLGHLEFTQTLLLHNPKLATELDTKRRSPLHLASAEGHKEIVQALLKKFDDACSLPDHNGMIPLHYAAMRGRVEVLKELKHAKPSSIYVEVQNRKETVLHLCVKYNQLECLKLLIDWVGENSSFINSRDSVSDGGKTILQLALTLNQMEIVRYLLSLPVIKTEPNDVNTLSYVLDQNNLGDSRSVELQQILGFHRISENSDNHKKPVVRKREKARGWIKKFLKYLKNPEDWLQDTRGMLMVVATMMSTMTFQAVSNPPGGVWQDNISKNTTNAYGKVICSEERNCFAGEAVLAYLRPDTFLSFVNFNIVTFLASLSVTLLLISGFPLHNRLCMWILSMAMCLTLTYMVLTFFFVIDLVTPEDKDVFTRPTYLNYQCLKIWIGLLVAVFAVHIVRFLIWLPRMLWRLFKLLRKIVRCYFNIPPTAPKNNGEIINNAPVVV